MRSPIRINTATQLQVLNQSYWVVGWICIIKNNEICGFDRRGLMVSGTNCFSQLMLMHYPQLQEQHHTLASESINSIFLLKKKSQAP